MSSVVPSTRRTAGGAAGIAATQNSTLDCPVVSARSSGLSGRLCASGPGTSAVTDAYAIRPTPPPSRAGPSPAPTARPRCNRSRR